MLKEAKDTKVLTDESYDILNKDFQNTFAHIVHNEIRNKGKSSHGKRYHDEVKKFAVTLYYHSSKAYEFCRYVCFLFSCVNRRKMFIIMYDVYISLSIYNYIYDYIKLYVST